MSRTEAAIFTDPRTSGMTQDVFARLRSFIYDHTGIYFHDSKQYLVESRVSQRMRTLGLQDFHAYCDLLCRRRTQREMPLLLNSITINETSFFRHQSQFDAIANDIMPGIIAAKAETGDRTVRLWSAGCSTGEEAYTLAILCRRTLEPRFPEFQFSVMGTDINTEVLASARLGEYRDYAVRNVSDDILRTYFTAEGSTYRVGPKARRIVQFKRHNLMDAIGPLLREKFDFILCANVLIYFDLAARSRAVEHLSRHLDDHGILMVGFSESLHGVTEVMKPIRLRRLKAYRKG